MKKSILILISVVVSSWQITSEASMSKGKVLVVLSAADSIPLREGGVHPTGIFLGELTEPVEAMLNAGYEITFASPGGRAPTIDVDSYRLIYWHFSARKLQHARNVLSRLEMTGLSNPQVLEDIAFDESKLNEYVALFVPGGHGPLVDLYYQNMFQSQSLNQMMGKILLHFHENRKPTGLICHAPAVLAAAPTVDGRWIYRNYKVTGISRLTEWMNEDLPGFRVINGHVGEYPSDILRRAGARYVYKRVPMVPFVVEDRELMTGQDPFSAGLMARRWVRKLNAYIDTIKFR